MNTVDVLYSLRAWLNNQYPEHDIYLDKPVSEVARPYFKIGSNDIQGFQRTSVVVEGLGSWSIAYLAENVEETYTVISEIGRKLTEAIKINGYSSEEPEKPVASIIEGHFGQSEHSITVGFETIFGEFSKQSQPLLVSLEANKAINLAVLSDYYLVKYYYFFDNDVCVGKVPPSEFKATRFIIDADNTPINITWQPSELMFVKMLRVRDIQESYLEDPRYDNRFTGYCTFRVSELSTRRGKKLPYPMNAINNTGEIGGE